MDELKYLQSITLFQLIVDNTYWYSYKSKIKEVINLKVVCEWVHCNKNRQEQ